LMSVNTSAPSRAAVVSREMRKSLAMRSCGMSAVLLMGVAFLVVVSVAFRSV
jgi:hypothetical protein